jgi:hypothetical protein
VALDILLGPPSIEVALSIVPILLKFFQQGWLISTPPSV